MSLLFKLLGENCLKLTKQPFFRARLRDLQESEQYSAKTHYIGVVLHPESRQRLLDALPAKHANVIAHHITLNHAPTPEDFARFKDLHNKELEFHVTHHASDPKVQAVRISGLDHLHDKPNKHITISTAKGIAPVESNNLLKSIVGNELKDKLKLKGTLHFINKAAPK